MNLVLITIGFLLILTGIVGSFIPIIPGPIAGWFGLFVVYQSSFLNLDYFFLGITFIIAIFLGPIGIIIGAFLGAFVGELFKNRSNKLIAFKAAIGTLIGYLGGIILKLSIAIVFSIKFFKIILNNWNEIL